MYASQLSGPLLRRFNVNLANPGVSSYLGRAGPSNGGFAGYRRKIGLWFREQSLQVARACTRQFEFIAAQRVRRSLQIFHLYTRIWDEVMLRELIRAWRRRIARSARHFLLSAVCVTTYDWDREKISDQEVNSHKREIEEIYGLRDSTVMCMKCQQRTVVDIVQPDVKYCNCHGVKPVAASNRNHEWQPFIERQDMLVWRREEPGSGGLFAYKVYGSFPEVTAEDFFQVQIDVDYRKQWDPTARELQIVESDPKSMSSVNDRTDVIYWEMIWPRLFANRDYVFQRRWTIDNDQRIVVIVSKVTEHPKAPVRTDTYRVTTYWSYMVIRPYTEFHEPGIEFGLTYFDDPGVNVPSAITAWVAMTGLPDFISRMRQASKDYQTYKSKKKAAPSYITAKKEMPKERVKNDEEDERTAKSLNEKMVRTDALECTEQVRKNADETPKESFANFAKQEQGSSHHPFLMTLFS